MMLGSWCRIDGVLRVAQEGSSCCCERRRRYGVLDDGKRNLVRFAKYTDIESWRVRDGMRWEEQQTLQSEEEERRKHAATVESKAVDVGETNINEEEEEDVLIEFRDVHKSFGSKHILKGASFKIRRGEAVGIIGSSGTGKSTTLRLAAGLLEPDSGEILIKGEARQGLLSDDDTSDKLNIGLVFQSGALFDSLTVKENVGFMLYEHTSLSEEEISKAVSESLSKVGLSGVENLYPSELSGGMKKRVALARAIVTDTSAGANAAEQVIMYDEPTAGLDPVASTVIEDLIRSMHDPKYAKNRVIEGSSRVKSKSSNSSRAYDNEPVSGVSSYIVVTHQHSTIRRSVDRIIFLHGGKVVWEGDIKEFDTTSEPIVRQFASGSLEGPIVYV